MKNIIINEKDKAVLRELYSASYDYDFSYIRFSRISDETKLEKSVVRRYVRRLARAGFAEYGRGLFTEDGEMAGSGYRLTDAGKKKCEELGIEPREDEF